MRNFFCIALFACFAVSSVAETTKTDEPQPERRKVTLQVNPTFSKIVRTETLPNFAWVDPAPGEASFTDVTDVKFIGRPNADSSVPVSVNTRRTTSARMLDSAQRKREVENLRKQSGSRPTDPVAARTARPASDRDYVLEAPDVITVRLRCEGLPNEIVEKINGQHMVGPDGHITLGPLGRFSVQNKTLAGVETEIRDRLNKHPKVEKFRLHVDLFASNSKEYFVIVRSPDGTEHIVAFPCTGKETVLKAVTGMAIPAGSAVKMWLVRQKNDMALPAVMPIDWKAITAFGDPKTNYTLQPNDRIMIVEKEPVFRPHVTARDFMLESAQRKRDVENLRKQEPPVAARDPGTKIARSVFFDGECFDHEILATFITIRADLPEYREQSPYAFANIDGVTFGFMMAKESTDFWLIIYGDAEKVVELQRMFSQIAEEGKALREKR